MGLATHAVPGYRPPDAQSPTESSVLFPSIVCIGDATAAGQIARGQASALASGGGAVRAVSPPARAWHRPEAVLRLAAGADLLVLGADVTSDAVLAQASLPVLLSRWIPSCGDIAQRMLLAVEQSVRPDRAAELAASLAAHHDGTVILAPSLERDRGLQRAIAASRRIVLEKTGALPETHGEALVREAVIASAVRAADASLLVLPLGETAEARAAGVTIARHVTCPVLAVPCEQQGTPRRFARSNSQRDPATVALTALGRP